MELKKDIIQWDVLSWSLELVYWVRLFEIKDKKRYCIKQIKRYSIISFHLHGNILGMELP